jgi:pimeloyl-ACP methyl ester carboxylesterase
MLGSFVMAHASTDVTCRRVGVPVVLFNEQNVTYTISGELCATPAELVTGATVQLLIHGATYNYDYWDFVRMDGLEYSYARDVAQRGIATFAYDALGSGSSSHPPSDHLTLQVAADVAHQMVHCLRNGGIGGVQFGKVIPVGHSLGSVVVWQEAITYGDVDGLIVTGAAHSLTTRFLNANPFYPAANDPSFSGMGLDAGYLTTIPGIRASLFYSDPQSDPVGILSDEALKDVVPAAELTGGLPIVTSTATLAINVPVLTILGNADLPTCGANTQGGVFDCSSAAAVVAQEAPFYSRQIAVSACIIPDSGHDISLSPNRHLQVEDAVAWSNAFVNQAAGNVPVNCFFHKGDSK